jgi:hypothetical protein
MSKKRAQGGNVDLVSKKQTVLDSVPVTEPSSSISDGVAIVLPVDGTNEDVLHVASDETLSAATSLPVVDDQLRHAVDVVAVPPVDSPSRNRERFMMNCQPLRVSCNLGAVGLHAAGIRFSFQAVVFVVYPPSDKPERRHVLLVDSTGSCGLTVWGAHVSLFTFATVGTVVKFTKLGMTIHNGKRSLSMGRDTTIVFLSSTLDTEESKWWNSLASNNYKRIIDVHDCEDDSIINVAGIVGMLSCETKRVRSDNKDLLTLRLTDRTGLVDVRSWNHVETDFKAYLEKPLLLKRVRVTSFSGLKILELLDGNGSIVVSSFDGMSDLQQYWQE